MSDSSGNLPVIAISQRVVIDALTGERRDSLDQRWFTLAKELDCILWPLPNDAELAQRWLQRIRPHAVILSGGNDVGAAFGTQAPHTNEASERDRAEAAVLEWSVLNKVPVLGVCRGMQILNVFLEGKLRRMAHETHVAKRHAIVTAPGALEKGLEPRTDVNSYHTSGLHVEDLGRDLMPFAFCGDVVEAIAHKRLALTGIMWHPEREHPFVENDLRLLRCHLHL